MSEWIKCSEILPEIGQEVIVYEAEEEVVQSGMIYKGAYQFGHLFVDFNEEYYEVINPPHWQPLPPPPQD